MIFFMRNSFIGLLKIQLKMKNWKKKIRIKKSYIHRNVKVSNKQFFNVTIVWRTFFFICWWKLELLEKKQVAKLKFTYFDLKQIEPSKQFRKLENTVLDHLTSIITYCTLRSCRNPVVNYIIMYIFPLSH